MNQVMRTMIIAAQDQALAQQLAVGAAGTPATNMWIVGLSPTGATPATHYISNGMIDAQFAILLGDANATFTVTGGTIPLASIQGMYSRATIQADADPFAVMANLGLQFVKVTI